MKIYTHRVNRFNQSRFFEKTLSLGHVLNPFCYITRKTSVITLLFIILLLSTSAIGQRTTTIDVKGTKHITGNVVTEAATAPTTPTPIQGDVWFDTTNRLVKTWDGGTWKTVASSDFTVVGQRHWELAHSNHNIRLADDLGFAANAWSTIPFNTTPIVVNTSGGSAGFSFNADSSITFEAVKAYHIIARFGDIQSASFYTLRLVDKSNSSNVLAYGQFGEGTIGGSSTVYPSMDVLVIPNTTADYVLQYYTTNSSGRLRHPSIFNNVLINRATITVEKLKD